MPPDLVPRNTDTTAGSPRPTAPTHGIGDDVLVPAATLGAPRPTVIATLLLVAAAMTTACPSGSEDEPPETAAKQDEATKAEYPDSYFVCATKLPWPDKLKRSDPIERLARYCEKGSWDRAKVKAQNCAKETEARAAQECSRLTFSNRARAAALKGNPAGKAWAEEMKAEIASDSRLKLVESGDLPGYVQAIGERVAAARQQPTFSGAFTFNVFETSDEALGKAAFALPDGNIYVSASLIDALDESEIAFILGHEVAQVEWSSFDEEVLAQFSTQSRIEELGGKFLSVCAGPMDEVLADERAVEYSVRAGYDPSAGARVMWGAWRNHELLREFAMAKSHPPSSMRASYIFLDAKKLASEPVFFRGSAKQTEAWDGSFPEGKAAGCKE